MRTLAVPTCVLVAVTLASPGAQTPPTPPDEQHRFIDTLSATEAEAYRIAVLFNVLVVLERP